MRISDWSSDVCSSDLAQSIPVRGVTGSSIFFGQRDQALANIVRHRKPVGEIILGLVELAHDQLIVDGPHQAIEGAELLRERSEERRVGKECVSTSRYRWSQYH